MIFPQPNQSEANMQYSEIKGFFEKVCISEMIEKITL